MSRSAAVRHSPQRRARSGRPAAGFVMSLAAFSAVVWICGDTLLGDAWRGFLLNEGMLLAGREPVGVPSPVTVTVPDLTGQPFSADALPSDVYTVEVTYVYDDKPARTVLDQTPPPGSRRKALPDSRTVPLRLTVSAGPHTVPVPGVQLTDSREAAVALTERGFTVTEVPLTLTPSGVLTAPDGQRFRCVPHGTTRRTELSRLQAGTALFTEPPAGTDLCVGASVTLYVLESTPSPSPLCPSLIGLHEDEARQLLSARGIAVGSVTRAVSADAGAGTVLSQSRLPGTRLPPDDSVDLIVAEAPPPRPAADPRHFWTSYISHSDS
ncbi:MAG: PASTA domain-containing protein [Clostridia bacterium]|nr:PASTA domain-containing protein [Clostridia bacterium]